MKMQTVPNLADHLAPDSIRSLGQAAICRFEDAMQLQNNGKTMAIYFYGYCAEMLLASAYYRRCGYAYDTPIDSITRRRTMARARGLLDDAGQPLMEQNHPHPIAGWARLLRWHRVASPDLTDAERARLNQAVKLAEGIYLHWRPELRYKTTEASVAQLKTVHDGADWLMREREKL